MSVLPFPSFLDDIKEKGLKRAVFEGVNEIVERATAGMNLQDIREALRGDSPSRVLAAYASELLPSVGNGYLSHVPSRLALDVFRLF